MKKRNPLKGLADFERSVASRSFKKEPTKKSETKIEKKTDKKSETKEKKERKKQPEYNKNTKQYNMAELKRQMRAKYPENYK